MLCGKLWLEALYYSGRNRISLPNYFLHMASAISAQPVSPAISELQLDSVFKPEFDFLLACCANGSPSGRSERIRRNRPLNWMRVIELAEHHGVIPQIYRSLSDLGDVACSDSLWQSHETNARKALWLTRELLRILGKLNSCGIVALPYKGPVLAQLLYGNVTLRQFSDLDLLIQSSDLPRIKSALAELGFEPGVQLTPREEREYVESGYEYAFDCAHGRNLLEVQWRILPRFYCVDFDVDGFFERAITFSLGGTTLRTLCTEDLLIVLCVHAAKHAWQQLSWLCDIGELAKSREIDWDVIRDHAKRLGVQRIVAISFFLAHKLLEARLPEIVQTQIQKDDSIENLANEILPIVVARSDYDPESIPYFWLMIRVRERWRDRVKFLWRLIFTPSVGEWSAIRLPSRLFSLYRVVRIFRLVSRCFPKVVSARETNRSSQ